jgi:hypothetical protein
MSDEKPETWPFWPSSSAYVTHGLCMAIADIVQGHRKLPHPRHII